MSNKFTIFEYQLLSGLFYPQFSAAAGAMYSIGRLIYAFGYRAFGPKGRLVGALLFDVALLALFVTTMHAGLVLSGTIKPYFSLP